MSEKVALITGITGQDGAYLSEFLLQKGYIVHGLKRRSSLFNTARIDHLYQDPHEDKIRLKLHYGDLTDSTNLIRLIQEIQPDEIYNLAAQSHVMVSFEIPEYTANADAVGALRLLEAIRILNLKEKTRFYQASTSELYGKVQEVPQTESTPFYPRSPYGVAKLYAYWITKNYREAYDFYSCNGILFNHESPVRGETFVTRKITRAVAAIAYGFSEKLFLGNLSARRDWGHAKDYVEAMWLMLQQKQADDYVIATGTMTSVRDFCAKAFLVIGIHLEFSGSGPGEVGIAGRIDTKVFQDRTGAEPKITEGATLIAIDSRYFRPAEVEELVGDASKANRELNWKPKYSLDEMIHEMVLSDLQTYKRESFLKQHGHTGTQFSEW